MKDMVIRSTLLVAGLLLGAHAVAQAQTPDTIFTVRSDGQTLLRLRTDAGFLVAGSPGVGKIPAEGPGVRMMWFPARWAFRAGKVDSDAWNLAKIGKGSVAFGVNTIASGEGSFAAGLSTIASGSGATALGAHSVASGDSAFAAVGGTASEKGSVAIGSGAEAAAEHSLALGKGAKTPSYDNSISIGPNIVDGYLSVAIGSGNVVDATWYSVFIGTRAQAIDKDGVIILSDACGTEADTLYATADNQITMRGCGGIRLFTDLAETAGVELAPGGSSWLTVSDVNRKENFEVLDGEDVLRRLREVPVMTWNYKSQDPSIRHAGPTAQDFRAAFGLGESELMINTVDIDGINLAAVKALEARTRELAEATAEIEELRAELAAHKRRIEALERRQKEILGRLGRIESRR